MNIFTKFWNWLSKPEATHPQPVEKVCCGQCDCAPKVDVVPLTEPSPAVTEFYANDEGYAKAAYVEPVDAEIIDAPATALKPQKMRTQRKPVTNTPAKKAAKKTPPAKKQTPKKKK